MKLELYVFPEKLKSKFDYSQIYISPEAMKDIIKWAKEDSMKEYDDLYIVYGGEG